MQSLKRPAPMPSSAKLCGKMPATNFGVRSCNFGGDGASIANPEVLFASLARKGYHVDPRRACSNYTQTAFNHANKLSAVLLLTCLSSFATRYASLSLYFRHTAFDESTRQHAGVLACTLSHRDFRGDYPRPKACSLQLAMVPVATPRVPGSGLASR